MHPAVESPAAVEPPPAREEPAGAESPPDPLVLEELLVEDVSIDGMCGVY
jgi:mycofactocin precursor